MTDTDYPNAETLDYFREELPTLYGHINDSLCELLGELSHYLPGIISQLVEIEEMEEHLDIDGRSQHAYVQSAISQLIKATYQARNTLKAYNQNQHQ